MRFEFYFKWLSKIKSLMSKIGVSGKGLTSKEALKKLSDAIKAEISQYETETDTSAKCLSKKSVFYEVFHHCSPYTMFPWPSAVLSFASIILLLVCYFQEEQNRFEYMLFEAFVLAIMTIVNIYILIYDTRLMHCEILDKVKTTVKYIDRCISKSNWKSSNYPQLNMPVSPCITLQRTYRDGEEVNIHWPLLVEGDVINLRLGQIVPARCRSYDDPSEPEINFEDIYAPPQDHSYDIFSTPQMRSSAPTKDCVLLETPFIRHLRLILQKSRDRPISFFVKERYIVLVRYLQCAIIPSILVIMLIVNSLRYFYLWHHVGHWTEMFILLQIDVIIPLLPLAFPICWFLLNTYGLARILGMFLHSKQSESSCDIHVDDWGETAPSLQLIVDFNWRQLKRNMYEVLIGKDQTLCRTANILHALGSVTTLCCIDKKGILSGPNPTPEKVFFLKAKSRNNSADIITDENNESSRESVLCRPQEFSTRFSEHDGMTGRDGCIRESQVEVLDLTHNNQVPFCVQFDDPKWKKHINSLKPLGLAILLNTCNPKTQNYYTDFYSHITYEALHNDVVVPVVSRRCLCDLARHIGFTDKASDIFELQQHLSTFRHLPAEHARRDKLARSMPCSKVRFPFPHMASVVVKELNTGMSQLMSQGTCDLIMDCCSDFWDGQDLQPLSESDRKKILDFYHRSSLTSYCSAFSYRPLNAQISDYFNKLYLEVPAKSDRLYSSLFSPSPHRSCDRGKWMMTRCLSSDSLLGHTQDLTTEQINDAESCLEAQCNQVFIGMVAMQYQVRPEMVRLIEQLDKACIRFVHFSKENELRSRVFSEKMGLESGWNCHISLLSEKSKSECGTSTKVSQLSLNRNKQQSSIDEILCAIDGIHSPKLKQNLEVMKQLSYSAPSAINLERNTVKFDDDISSISTETDNPMRTNNDEMRGTSALSHDECDITQALIENRRASAISSRSPSRITESTESVPIAFDMSNRAKLPKGIENIRPHLENIDNVPLLVSLFTDCTPDVTVEMLTIMQEYGEVACVMGSSANIYNLSMFIQADASVAIEPLYPQLCVRPTCESSDNGGFSLITHRLLSIPCSLEYHQNDPVSLYHLVIEARHFTMAMRNCFYFYLSCSLSLSILIFLSSVFLLPPILTSSHILFMVLFTIPILSISLIGRPLDEEISTIATAKNIHIITKKVVFGFLGYLSLRFLPSVAVILLCFTLTLRSLCLRITQSSQHTCSYIFGDIDYEQPNEWNGWSQNHFYSLSVAHNINAFFLSVYYVCISLNFVHRSHQLWNKSPLTNRLWIVCAIAVVVIHLAYLAVDLHLKAGQANVLPAGLEDVAIEVWIIACTWPILLITINEFVKRHLIKIEVRYQKRARLEFGTKLGMNSPF